MNLAAALGGYARAGVIGVTGTLLGSAITYLFQSRAAKRAEAFARE